MSLNWFNRGRDARLRSACGPIQTDRCNCELIGPPVIHAATLRNGLPGAVVEIPTRIVADNKAFTLTFPVSLDELENLRQLFAHSAEFVEGVHSVSK